MINIVSEGALMEKTLKEARDLISTKEVNSQQFGIRN
jgi:hypothetical protein